MSSRLDNRSQLQLSLLLLGGVVMLALVGLALEGNWPKMVRVATSFGVYALLLFPGAKRYEAASLIRFMVAGGVAGLVSGLVRPDALPLLVVATQAAAGGLLIGPLHWLALRWQQRVRSRIVV